VRLVVRIGSVRYWGLLLLTASLSAQTSPTFNFPDFSSTASLKMVASARRAGRALRLTPARNDENGAVWHTSKQTVSGGFETEFQFQLTGQGGLGKGADGLAFVLQNSGPSAIAGKGSSGGFAIGDGGGNMRVPGIARSIAVFFDTFKNGEEHDPSDNYISICTHGRIGEMQWPPPRLAMVRKLDVKMKDKRVHYARITYEPPVMRIYLDSMKTPVLSSTVDLSTVVDADGTAFVGFTASTGGGWENHDLLSWSFKGLMPDVSSNMSIVSSSISFLSTVCLPDRNLCTPERAVVEEKAPGEYHVVLPANLEWGASIPNRGGQPVEIRNARGMVCWDIQGLDTRGCSGPAGGGPAGEGFLAPGAAAGALVNRNRDGRTWFSVNDRNGRNFADNQGYFEFEIVTRR
jgi:Legume lectin domain